LTDEMPIATTYKGVGIHAGQSAKRVALVKREIDKVNKISDLEELLEIAGDCSWSPESRLFAEARCIAGLQIATERRQAHPDIDKEDVVVAAAGLSVLKWAHPDQYCSLLDSHPERAARRDEPLDDDDAE
jgi:hypothetical protein